MATKFNATIEFISGQSAAIIDLQDERGEWAGGGRVEVSCSRSLCGHNVRDSLYEAGYRVASMSAASKGGSLETYRVAP